MKWIGLTGGIATGKSTAAEMFRALGVPVICADQLAKDVVQIGSQGLKEVVRAFGPDILKPDGSLDRKALGAKVFGSPDKLLVLEGIIHPEVRRLQRESRERLKQAQHKIAIYDVPLLFEKNLEGDFDLVIVVACAPQTQLQRLMKRDQLSEADARKRINSQLPIEEKIKRADFTIRNDGTPEELRMQVQALFQKL